MRATVFVDGQAGTVGLRLLERLAGRSDLEVVTIAEQKRKDLAERKRLINLVDYVFLCLPDAAAKESVALVEPGNERTRILDASTAHRTNPAWAYGIPELSPAHRKAIASAKRVAVPGCHASGFALGLYPLVQRGIVPLDYPVTCTSLTGYSGAGKETIATYENPQNIDTVRGSRPYALNLTHKHLPEMQAACKLATPPVFQPVICNFHSGMIVSIPLLPRLLTRPLGAAALRDELAAHYEGSRFVEVMPYEEVPTVGGGFLDPTVLNDTNRAQVFVFGNADRAIVSTRFDNLGKGASGAAVQCLNIMLGADEGLGLK